MLVKPLAFKGPTNHLTDLFGEQQLFEGLQLLLKDRLSQWHFEQATNWVSAQIDDGQSYQTEISWPLSAEGNHCSCSEQKNCVHMAGLAIETKRQLHQIAYPHKDASDELTLWQQTKYWLLSQHHDPFPNMARHRLVYLLKREADQFYISCYKAYLTQENRYLLKDKFDYQNLSFNKLPKFVSLLDQKILYLCQQSNLKFNKHSDRADLTEPNLFYLQNDLLRDQSQENSLHDQILQLMLSSGRCFWKASSRPALKQSIINKVVDHNQADEHFNHSDIDLPGITPHHYFDISHNRVITLLEKTRHLTLDAQTIQPCLTVASFELDFPWRQKAPLSLNVGQISFQQNDLSFSYQQALDEEATLADTHKQQLAACLRTLESTATVSASHDLAVAEQFDIADRCLNLNTGQLAVWLVGLKQLGWKINIDRSFHLNKQKVDDWYLDVSRDQDWFELELGIKINGQSFNIMPYLVQQIRNGQINLNRIDDIDELTVQLDSGDQVVLESDRIKHILKTLAELFDKKPLTEKQTLRLPNSHISRLSQLEQQQQPLQWQGDHWLKQQAERINNARPNTIALPKQLNAELRHYQKEGVNWLQFLQQFQLGGILADDMGLGKTLQSLAHLLINYATINTRAPTLIIAPTSLIANWQSEANKFTPSLKCMTFYGTERHRSLEEFSDYSLIITSYGVLQRDVQQLNKIEFDTIILDEAQAIKNAKTKLAKCCFSLRAKHRFCLTGTPIENHLGELWSLFNFLMPGFLGSEAQFNRLYKFPIEKEHNDAIQKTLVQRIRPFMLRRTKDKVAKELPPKTEFERLIEMDDQQADFYEAVRLSMAEDIQKAIQQQGVGKNQLRISNALLRLRQICCHPQLVKLSSSHSIEQSAKLSWLENALPEMIEEGRRILLFSSFTSMLDIIEQRLNDLSINTLKLTGKSTKRGELVSKFQQGKTSVFLISLKAGGSGLNLTAADTVIHYDPWWNPAAEDQASDRAYRIGQDKPVFVYKLITRGTVEERILKMQKNKHLLADKVLSHSMGDLQTITSQNWQSLFTPIE
jgi:non-specific serine/threonine protein kinase